MQITQRTQKLLGMQRNPTMQKKRKKRKMQIRNVGKPGKI